MAKHRDNLDSLTRQASRPGIREYRVPNVAILDGREAAVPVTIGAMMRELPVENRPAPRSRGLHPDPFYYLTHFHLVLTSLHERYAELLSPAERQFIVRFDELPRASRALLVRMVMRRGDLFRATRLDYPEIGATSSAVAPLLALGWVEDRPELDVQQLAHLLMKAELLGFFPLSQPYRNLKKPELVAVLHAKFPESKPFNVWYPESTDRVYRLIVDPLCERFRLMFFGNFRQGWKEFVLTDLGVFTYEKLPASGQSLPFRTRAHIEAFEQLYRCAQSLDAGTELDAVTRAIPPPIADCDWLEDRRQRLLFRIAGAYERQGDSHSALVLYSSCKHRGARLRTIRLRERAQEWQIARDLSLMALQNPESETERQKLQRILPRLNRRLGVPKPESCAPTCIPSFDLVVGQPKPGTPVEYTVRDHLACCAQDNSTVHYVENGLVNSLFGLLCWTAIFAPIPGAFFHDFHTGPADLTSGHFHARRQGEFAACFEQLNTDEYKATIRQRFTAKAGIQSPFVAWGSINQRLLELALTCFPPTHLRLWFEWIVRDIGENRAGFPDLVQFWPMEARYRLIEVKGPGDQLQDNQRRLLEYCCAHHLPVSVCRVRWVSA
jgi:hypothetical protein